MNIEDILDDLKVEFVREGHHHCRPGWIQLHCPFYKHGEGFHLGWNLSSNYANCWKCGGHHPDKLLVELGVSRKRAKELAGGIESDAPIDRAETRIAYKAPGGLTDMQEPHLKYLRKRGFDPEEIARLWKVQGIGLHTRLSWRLFIPIIVDDTAVSWTSRAISNKVKQRYLSASAEEEKINHKHLLYGQDYCSHSIVVCEGPTDVWNIGPGAAATFGTSFTTAQVNRIVQHPCRYLCFDGSSDAQARAEALADQLSAFPGITENILLDAEDPGSADPKEISLLRKAARL